MTENIGLTLPTYALILFGLIFNPWLVHRLPQEGWLAAFLSPQIYFLMASIVIMQRKRLSWEAVGISKRRLNHKLLHIQIGPGRSVKDPVYLTRLNTLL